MIIWIVAFYYSLFDIVFCPWPYQNWPATHFWVMAHQLRSTVLMLTFEELNWRKHSCFCFMSYKLFRSQWSVFGKSVYEAFLALKFSLFLTGIKLERGKGIQQRILGVWSVFCFFRSKASPRKIFGSAYWHQAVFRITDDLTGSNHRLMLWET